MSVFVSESQIPRFEDLNENSFAAMLKKLECQDNTIKLLQLQLKSTTSKEALAIIEDKDKIISSLEKKIEELSLLKGGESGDSAQLEQENFELEQKLREKNQTLRKIERKYNEHLNELNDKIEALEEEKEELQKQLKAALNAAKNTTPVNTGISNAEVSLRNNIKELEEIIAEKNDAHSELTTTNQKLKERLNQLEKELAEIAATPVKKVESTTTTTATNNSSQNNLSETLPLRFFESFLEIVDKFAELSRQNPDDETFTHIHESSLFLLKELKIESFDSVGQNYNPDLHHKTDVVYSTEQKHNSVFRELSRGFYLNGRVFRRAGVVLSMNPVHCHNCGTVGSNNSHFCSQCGTKLLFDAISSSNGEPKYLNDKENAAAYTELGESYLRSKEYQFAREAFNKAHALEPTSVEAILGLVRVEEAAGNYQNALEKLDELSRLPGTNRKKNEIETRIQNKTRILEALQALV
jgi:molecular chaperone GrpE